MITPNVPQMFYSGSLMILPGRHENRISPAQAMWGGWGSNPRPADYESAALTG
jgi:hypothetical protein